MISLHRRSLLKGLAGILAVGMALPIVRAASIMPVKVMPSEPEVIAWNDGYETVETYYGSCSPLAARVWAKRLYDEVLQDSYLAKFSVGTGMQV